MLIQNWILEVTVLFMFVCLLGIVCAGSLFIVRRAARAGWRTYKFSQAECVVLFLGLAGLLCICYGFVEPYRVDTTYVRIMSSKLHSGAGPIRIVHISDLHCDGTQRTEKKLPLIVQSLHPDIIVFTGDAANNLRGLVDFRECIQALSTVAPTFAVYGNHDSRGGRTWDIYSGTDVRMLNCYSEIITIKGSKVWIGGVAVDNEKCFAQTLQKSPGDAFTVFLYHYPVGVNAVSSRKIDLFLAGHTHGGQVRLPLYGALVTNSPLGKQFEWGLYKVAGTSMYVNRGIGMIGMPVRFLAPPEITVIDVSPNSSYLQ